MRRSLAAAASALLLFACGERAAPQPGILTREQFIGSYVALRRARSEATSKPDFEVRRDELLGQRGVTSEQMRAFVRAHGSDLGYMRELWEEIARRLEPKEEPRPDTARPRPPTPTRSSTAASS